MKRIKIYSALISGLFSKLPFQVKYFFNKQAKRNIEAEIGKLRPDLIYCQLVRMAEYVREVKNIPKVLDYQDAFSKGAERRISYSKFFMKRLLQIECNRLKKYEVEIFDDFVEKIIISEADRDAIGHQKKEKIHVISNGVDFNYFHPVQAEKKFDVVFTGNMSYPPNKAGTFFLVKEIFPLLKKKYPAMKILIAGTNPPSSIKNFSSGNIFVTGWVKDMQECYAACKIFVAPMFFGAGLQNKLLEAMAMKLPCITTTLAGMPLKATDGENILIADTAREFCNKIAELLEDKKLYEKISANGFEFVQANYNWETEVEKLENVFEKVAHQVMA